MPCVLTVSATGDISGPKGKDVTVEVRPGTLQKLAAARYNSKDLTVTNDTTTTFALVQDLFDLSMSISGHWDAPCDLQLIEMAADGTTQVLYEYKNDWEPNINLEITGV